MKKKITYIYSFVFFLIPSLALAHGNEAEELGHHWKNPAYIKEIWMQSLTIIIVCSAYIFINSLIKSRKESRRSNEK